ncbi:hypothetical protein NPIL_457821 [Nephila pilipes]|uniref:Uncharacterized protein n=1 Tax=Nephila pilipes TaxID=299642 RepID=A0A8X6ITK6_NEPPI|nr:hypothetical protein NPIL_457821 [Nephila pilipes]
MVIAVSDLEFITKRSNGEDKTDTSRVRYGTTRHVFSVLEMQSLDSSLYRRQDVFPLLWLSFDWVLSLKEYKKDDRMLAYTHVYFGIEKHKKNEQKAYVLRKEANVKFSCILS